MLSSRTLLDELPAYLRAEPSSLSAKQLHIERAVIKYVTRSHAKTSPFSTFGRLALAEPTDLGGAIWLFDDSLAFTSQVRISSSNWLKLRPLVLAIRGIADHLRVRPNPTLESSPDGHKFLRNVHNVESFQTLPPFDELTVIAELAGDSPPFETLLHRVSSAEAVEGNEDDVRAFLDRLIAEGFLEFDAGISGTDPDWDLSLVSLLGPMASECPAAAEIVAALNEIREQLRLFGTGGLADRDKIVVRCQTRLAGLLDYLMAAGGSQKHHVVDSQRPPEAAPSRAPLQRDPRLEQQYLLYEDSAISQPAIQIESLELRELAESLSTLTRYMGFADGLHDERSQLTHYCVAKYGEGAVPLIRVYEDYYRDCKVPEQRLKQESKTSDSSAPIEYPGAASFRAASESRSRALNAWIESLAIRLHNDGRASAERVDIVAEDLVSASALLVPPHEPVPFAGSAYVQMITPGEGNSHCIGVVNGVAAGYGKMMSRFLELFPGEVAELMRTNNRNTDGFRLAEVRDASVSNANMHPPLLDFEISSPGAQTSFPPDKQIAVSDLFVEIGKDAESSLSLYRRSTGERLEVLDLGFLGLPYRSQLLQLLVRGFSRAKYVSFYPLLRAATAAASPPPGSVTSNGVVCRPRMVFNHRLVLQRRSWTVDLEALPVRWAAETDASFYVRVNQWRETNGMPPHVFVFLTRDKEAARKKGSKLSRDDYKPQFISFQNWFTIDLFERMVSKATKTVFIEEMLPSADSMLRIGGRRHPAELIIQWAPRVP
jgi:hypothetical protein